MHAVYRLVSLAKSEIRLPSACTASLDKVVLLVLLPDIFACTATKLS